MVKVELFIISLFKLSILLLMSFLNLKCTIGSIWQPIEQTSKQEPEFTLDDASILDQFETKDSKNDDGDDDDDDDDDDSTRKSKQIELKQARIWARVDQIEGLLYKQKQQIEILERSVQGGVPLDLLKENMRNKSNQDSLTSKDKGLERKQPHPSISSKHTRHHIKNKTHVESNDSQQHKLGKDLKVLISTFTKQLEDAREMFQKGRFGKAYIEFSRLDREFDLSVTKGEPKYWLGRTWYKLREYKQASQSFEQFIRENINGPWIPSAKYYKAKSQYDMGLQEIAINNLQEMISEHPNEGSSEAARQMLKNIRQTL